jgi:uncharacterized protein YndB with AHSA1/START domain
VSSVPRYAAPVTAARVSMLVRRPVSEVFEAFVDPDQITGFWLASASGPLEPEATVHWEFLVPGAEVDSTVTRFERDRVLEIAWTDGTTVAWRFTEHAHGTAVEIENAGFAGDPAAVVEAALEATQGFTIVLCDLKTFLEGGASARLSRDKAVLIEAELAASADHHNG